MDDENTREIVSALGAWAATVSNPDEPVLQLMGEGITLSTRQIIDAVEHDTDTGKVIIRMLEAAARRNGWEETLDKFRKPGGQAPLPAPV